MSQKHTDWVLLMGNLRHDPGGGKQITTLSVLRAEQLRTWDIPRTGTPALQMARSVLHSFNKCLLSPPMCQAPGQTLGIRPTEQARSPHCGVDGEAWRRVAAWQVLLASRALEEVKQRDS